MGNLPPIWTRNSDLKSVRTKNIISSYLTTSIHSIINTWQIILQLVTIMYNNYLRSTPLRIFYSNFEKWSWYHDLPQSQQSSDHLKTAKLNKQNNRLKYIHSHVHIHSREAPCPCNCSSAAVYSRWRHVAQGPHAQPPCALSRLHAPRTFVCKHGGAGRGQRALRHYRCPTARRAAI